MDFKAGIKLGLHQGTPYKLIARKVFLSYPTYVFQNKEEIEFEIKNRISEKFWVPISSIQVSGSSKTGFSFFKERDFIPGESDLDIAIISLPLFIKYSEISHKLSNGYSDQSKFPRKKSGESQVSYFLANLNNGYFRPDLMPASKFKTEWFEFYNELSNRYYDIFKTINAGIYSTEYFFESKQVDCIYKFEESNKRI